MQPKKKQVNTNVAQKPGKKKTSNGVKPPGLLRRFINWFVAK